MGKEHKDILDGIDQVLKYAGEYYSGRTQYRVNGQQVKVNAFLLATRYSESGYLYAKEDQLNYLPYSWLADNYNMIEKPITHSTTRFLWRQWEPTGYASLFFERLRRHKAKETINPPHKPFVGVLVAKTCSHPRAQTYETPFLYLNSNLFIPMNRMQIQCFDERMLA